MANSKSNIYPIQLQGAELNLNKYDAEIKQYSGFNKNNSPFVGGCLSNLFTKDETIEGANSDNTYIAPNGDVYRVTTEGLFKNDTKLIGFSGSGSFFINRKKLESQNVIKWYSDKFKLSYEETGNTSRFYLNNIIVGSKQLSYMSPEEAAFYQSYGYFTTINNINCFVFGFYTFGAKLWIFNADTKELLLDQWILEDVGMMAQDYLVPFTLFQSDSSNILAICESANGGVYPRHELRYIKIKINVDFSISKTSYYYSITDNLSYAFQLQHSNSYNLISPYVYDYILCGAPQNQIYARKTRDSNNGVAYYRFSINTTVNGYGTESGNKLVVSGGGSIGEAGKPIINSDENNIFMEQEIKDNGIILQGYCSYLLQAISSDNKTYIKNIGCSNVISLQDKTMGDYSRKRAVSVGGFYRRQSTNSKFILLINNGNISGIASQDGTLLTDWNAVDPYSIFSSDNYNSVTYKEGNTFYFLEASDTPKLRVLENQIIINKGYYNTYFLNLGKIGHFACGYNFFIEEVKSDEGIDSYLQSDVNNLWIAAAANEYNLKENASIILNPQNIFHKPTSNIFVSTEPIFYTYIINLYYGESSSCLYQESYLYGKKVINKDLYKLPFPSNTDGNVQYSPSLFSEIKDVFGDKAFIKSGDTYYPLMKENNIVVMSFFLASGIDNLEEGFIVQGQFYGIINNGIYSINYNNGVVSDISFVVSVENLQFCGNTPYEALFYSATNRCLYSFTGANVLNTKQLVDKIGLVKSYKYNPATQSIFLITDIGVIISGLFGIYLIAWPECEDVALLNDGIVLTDNLGHYRTVKYYKENTDDSYTKENIQLDTCFYGMNNQTVTINDCLYMRLFSEEMEEGSIEVSATTLSLQGRMTEKTTFKIRKSDWDKETNTIYLRYQPKEQRGLGISFKINSPFKIASMSVGSQADAILVDKISKGAVTAPKHTSSNIKW